MKRLLLTPFNVEVEQAITRTLLRIGASVDVATAPEDVLRCLQASNYDVVVTDRVLAGEHFDSIIETLRGCTSPKPVVIVTSTVDGDLDPSVVSLVVPASYDAPTLVGVVLACVTESTAVQAPQAPAPQLDY